MINIDAVLTCLAAAVHHRVSLTGTEKKMRTVRRILIAIGSVSFFSLPASAAVCASYMDGYIIQITSNSSYVAVTLNDAVLPINCASVAAASANFVWIPQTSQVMASEIVTSWYSGKRKMQIATDIQGELCVAVQITPLD